MLKKETLSILLNKINIDFTDMAELVPNISQPLKS